MNALKQSIKILKDGKKAFKTYPIVILSGIAFALVTIMRIQLDWQNQEKYNFLFNSLHLAFAVGGFFSLALLTAEKIKYNTKKTFVISNIIGLTVIVITFVLLYFFGGIFPESTRYMRLSNIASSRAAVAILVSLLSFTVIASYSDKKSNVTKSFFMTEKALIIALIYGLVIMAGTSGVAGAVQGLLYNDMSEKVYMYLATVSGFLAFTIFVGYFPDFRKDSNDEEKRAAQKQPKFVEILLEYILVPIILALTVVLILWAGRTVIQGIGNPFVVLSSIAAAYTLGGLWLHLMISEYESGIGKFYRTIYPFSALIILIFEAWALVNRLNDTGLKTEEYFFTLIWVVALLSAVLLLIKKSKAYKLIITIICIVAIVSVMPIIGYYDLTINMQLNRLETILKNQEMLVNGEIIPAEEELEEDTKVDITESVNFIAYSSENRDLPNWFDKDLSDSIVFREKFGFEKTWETNVQPSRQYMSSQLNIPTTALNVENYQWVINYGFSNDEIITFQGENGQYEIYWEQKRNGEIPNFKLTLNKNLIIEEDMNQLIDTISEKYPPDENIKLQPSIEDMTYIIESKDVEVMLIFRDIQINVDSIEDRIDYWLGLDSIYIKEK